MRRVERPTTEQPSLPKPVHFVASALKDIQAMPEDVQDVFGKSLQRAQWGGKASNAEPMKGFNGADVLEIRYRAVYTTRFPRAIYALHVFKKKSSQDVKTSKKDIERIHTRLEAAKNDYGTRHPTEEPSGKQNQPPAKK